MEPVDGGGCLSWWVELELVGRASGWSWSASLIAMLLHAWLVESKSFIQSSVVYALFRL